MNLESCFYILKAVYTLVDITGEFYFGTVPPDRVVVVVVVDVVVVVVLIKRGLCRPGPLLIVKREECTAVIPVLP